VQDVFSGLVGEERTRLMVGPREIAATIIQLRRRKFSIGAGVATCQMSGGHMKSATANAYPQLYREQVAFDAQLADLVREHEGEFVIFKDGTPVDFFSTYDEAYSEALARFGIDETYLVSEVKHRQPHVTSLAWEAGAMFR
jgi:hypothetical protein